MEAFLALIAIGTIMLSVRYNRDKVESLVETFVGILYSYFVQHMSIHEIQLTIQNILFYVQCGILFLDLAGIVGFFRAINNGSYHFGMIILTIEVYSRFCNMVFETRYHKYFSPPIIKCAKIAIGLYFNNPITTFTNTGLLIFSQLSCVLIKKASYIFLNVGIDSIIHDANVNKNSLQARIGEMLTKVETFADSRCENLQLYQIAIDICKQAVGIIDEVQRRIDNFYQNTVSCVGYLYACKITGTIISYLFFLHASIHIIPSHIIVAIVVKFVIILVEPVTPINVPMDNSFAVIKQKCADYRRAIQLTNLSIRGVRGLGGV
jgi:hypothetical protein